MRREHLPRRPVQEHPRDIGQYRADQRQAQPMPATELDKVVVFTAHPWLAYGANQGAVPNLPLWGYTDEWKLPARESRFGRKDGLWGQVDSPVQPRWG